MARLKKPMKYLVITIGLFTFYFMFIDQLTENNGLNNSSNFLEKQNIIEKTHDNEIKLDKSLTKTESDIFKFGKVHRKENKYFFNMSTPHRLNKLFDIIYEKEKVIESTLRKLDLVVFEDIIKDDQSALPLPFKMFKYEINEFLKVDDKKVRATTKFADFLSNQSDYYTFKNPRKNIIKTKMSNVSILEEFLV